MENSVNGIGQKQQGQSAPEVAVPKRGVSALSLIALLVLLVLIGLTAYLFVSNGSLTEERSTLAASVERLSSDVGEAESKATLGTKKQFIEGKEADRILWTNVLNRIFETNPESSDGGNRLVNYNAISGGRDGNVSISIRTRSGAADPYVDTAILLREFASKSYFSNNFIPNIASVFDQVGQELLTYNMNLNYLVEEDPISDLVDEIIFEADDQVDLEDASEDAEIINEADSLRRRVESEETSDDAETLIPETDE